MAAVATLATQQINFAGLSPTFAAAGGSGDQFVPGERTFLCFRNSNAATRTVTIDSKVASNYGTDVDIGPITLPATTGEVWLGPFGPQRFAGATGLGDIAYSATAGVTVAVVSA